MGQEVELLEKWLKFAEGLKDEPWAVTKAQDPETYTREGVEMESLIKATTGFIRHRGES